MWARDGRRLFYRAAAGVWAVDLEAAAGLRPGKPRLLFRDADRYLSTGPGRAWDLSLDGLRLLMVKREGTKPQPVTRLVLVQNWNKELKRLFEARERER